MTNQVTFDLHIHSKYSSDALLSPKSILKIATRQGFSAIAVTDHNTIKGGVACKHICTGELVSIIGSEISTNYGDLIGLFLNEEINSRDFEEVIDEIRDQGGIVVLPHPYRRKAFPELNALRKIDILEGINGRTSPHLNEKALQLASDLKKPVIAGSDAHFPFEMGKTYNIQRSSGIVDEEEMRTIILTKECKMKQRHSHPIIQKTAKLLSYAIKNLNSIY